MFRGKAKGNPSSFLRHPALPRTAGLGDRFSPFSFLRWGPSFFDFARARESELSMGCF